MHEKLITAANAVFDEFMPAERAADVAAAKTARLLATFLEQRALADVSIGTGSVLVRKLAKSLTAQIEAREEFIMAHKLARALPDELGISPLCYGDTEECPPDDRRAYFAAAQDGNVVRLAAG